MFPSLSVAPRLALAVASAWSDRRLSAAHPLLAWFAAAPVLIDPTDQDPHNHGHRHHRKPRRDPEDSHAPRAPDRGVGAPAAAVWPVRLEL